MNIDDVDAIKWGRMHEQTALKQFYAQEAIKQQKYKLIVRFLEFLNFLVFMIDSYGGP